MDFESHTLSWLLSGIKDLTISVIDSSSHGLSWFITQSGLCNAKFLYVMIASIFCYWLTLMCQLIEVIIRLDN